MNHTPQRTRRKTTKRKRQRRKPLRGRFALLGAAVLLVLLLLRCGADEPQPGSAAADETAGETTAETQPVPATQAADPPSKDDPLLLLVSRAHPLAEDYAPELTQLHDWPYSIAAIAYEPLRQMLAAGRAEGLSFTVASAYRSTDSQRQLFDEDVEARVSEGMTEDEAREETARWTMPPGCSEHETGLAVDIVATDNQRLDDTQEQTPETIWLHENCWRFGFILRYPAGKEDVTGIDYESWHYRYVGIEAARYLTEQQRSCRRSLHCRSRSTGSAACMWRAAQPRTPRGTPRSRWTLTRWRTWRAIATTRATRRSPPCASPSAPTASASISRCERVVGLHPALR